MCSCIIIFYRGMFCPPYISQCCPALHSCTHPPLLTYFYICECCMSYPGHQLIPSCVERVHFLLYQLIQNASVHQCLGQLSDLVPVVLWVPQKNLQTLCAHTNIISHTFTSIQFLIFGVLKLKPSAWPRQWYCDTVVVLFWGDSQRGRKIENYAG